MQQVAWHGVVTSGLQLLRSSVWPLMIFAIAYLLRIELRQALGRLAHLKFREFEAEFRDELREAESVLPRHPGETEEAPRVRHELYQAEPGAKSLISSAKSPRDLIRVGWSGLELAMNRIKREQSKPLGGMESLHGPGLIQYERLRSLARMVERTPDWQPSQKEAERYRDVARSLAHTITSRRNPA